MGFKINHKKYDTGMSCRDNSRGARCPRKRKRGARWMPPVERGHKSGAWEKRLFAERMQGTPVFWNESEKTLKLCGTNKRNHCGGRVLGQSPFQSLPRNPGKKKRGSEGGDSHPVRETQSKRQKQKKDYSAEGGGGATARRIAGNSPAGVISHERGRIDRKSTEEPQKSRFVLRKNTESAKGQRA